ncbi:hypothetical protein chiPu_0029056, partial [Chiloscyllium punctatum]|nr:hypothetical protein [Chiloscyllium punctatum]
DEAHGRCLGLRVDPGEGSRRSVTRETEGDREGLAGAGEGRAPLAPSVNQVGFPGLYPSPARSDRRESLVTPHCPAYTRRPENPLDVGCTQPRLG